MRPLHPGQDAVLTWPTGALECRIVAAAGAYVLLQPAGSTGPNGGPPTPNGTCSLTYLDGLVPMGFEGDAEPGSYPGEIRFRVTDAERAADRRSSVRLPVLANVGMVVAGRSSSGQLLDISAGGLRVRHPHRHERGTPIRVTVQLPDGGPLVDADGVVRSSEPGISSVEFSTMHGCSAAEIGAWTVGMLRRGLRPRAAVTL